MEVFNHVVQTVLNLNEAEVASHKTWMKYLGYHSFLDLCDEFRENWRISIATETIQLKVSNVHENWYHEHTQDVYQLHWDKDER